MTSRVEPHELPVAGTVTMLFTDIEGSTRLLAVLGERYEDLLAEHDRVLRASIAATGGHEVDTAGDSFFAVFARARDALECARAIQLRLVEGDWPGEEPPRVRIGIHTGAPTISSGGYVGMDVHRAARVMSAAHGGQVLLTAESVGALGQTAQVRDLGFHRLKDLAEPEHLFQLLDADLRADFPPLRDLPFGNLPAPMHSFVGRVSEMATARQLLGGEARLLTLVGPGGSGKTRLGLEIASHLLPRYRDGVWFVSLASVSDSSLVASEIARILGIGEVEDQPWAVTVVEGVSQLELLLVLDNLEHLIDAAPLVSQLLASAPGVDVVVTSREPLHIQGEHRLEVQPLPAPDAAELFLRRARAISAPVGEDPEDVRAVAQICLRLDGLPLALELAAARVNVFSLSALDARLAQRLALPEGPRDTPDRHRTLRATIDWSYQLLSADEQTLFRGLAPFVGGARLEAIESIYSGAGIDPVATVAALVDKSLLRRRDDPDGLPRFWMLETIREYAVELLEASTESEMARGVHAGWCVALANAAEPELGGRQQATWLARLDADRENLRAAAGWGLVSDQPEITLELDGALWRFWLARGPRAEVRSELTAALSTSRGGPGLRAKALNAAGVLAGEAEDFLAARGLFEQALDMAGQAGDRRLMAGTLMNLGVVELYTQDHSSAITRYHEAGEIWRQLNDLRGQSVMSQNLAIVYEITGDLEQALALLEQSVELARAAGDEMHLAQTLVELGKHLVRHRVSDDRAPALLREGLALACAVGEQRQIIEGLEVLAAFNASTGAPEIGAELIGAGEAERARTGVTRKPDERPLVETTLARLEQVLGREEFHRARERGAGASLDAAIALALESTE